MSKNTGPKYTGVLKKPIRFPNPDQASTPEEYAAYFDQQFSERFAALFNHYGIKLKQPGAGFILAFNLAADHIKGFTVTDRGPGRTSKWIGDDGRKLYHDVQAIKQRGHSILNACRQLVKPGNAYAGEKAPSLKSRYHEICKTDPHVKFLEFVNTDIERMDKMIERLQAALGTDIRSK